MRLKFASLKRGLLPLLLMLAVSPAAKADTPRQLKWADLIPKAAPAAACASVEDVLRRRNADAGWRTAACSAPRRQVHVGKAPPAW